MAARRLSPLASATRALGARPRHLQRHRLALNDGAVTTLHVASYDLRRTVPRVVRLPPRRRWSAGAASTASARRWSAASSSAPAAPRSASCARAASPGPRGPFDAPWGDVRACLHVVGGHVALARRDELPVEPPGDLLQAGPLLVRHGVPCVAEDIEGFSAGPGQFDSDITAGRYPRAALALAPRGRLLAVACDGRADDEAGLTLAELAEALVALGAHEALNLDGGGSTSLVCAGGCATPRARTTASFWRAGAGLDRGRVHASITTSGTTAGCACSVP